MHHERPRPRWFLATLLAIGGCGLILLKTGPLTLNWRGILLAIGAGSAYAIYTAFSKEIVRYRSPEAAMAIIFSLGALPLMPVLSILDINWLWQVRSVAVVLHPGIVTMALAYTLFSHGMRTIPVATGVTLTLAEPLTASLSDVFLLGEPINSAGLAGIGVIFARLAVMASDLRSCIRVRLLPWSG